jgi:hypothetical protein
MISATPSRHLAKISLNSLLESAIVRGNSDYRSGSVASHLLADMKPTVAESLPRIAILFQPWDFDRFPAPLQIEYVDVPFQMVFEAHHGALYYLFEWIATFEKVVMGQSRLQKSLKFLIEKA